MRMPFTFACLFGGLILCHVSVFAQLHGKAEGPPLDASDEIHSPTIHWPDAADYKLRERLSKRISGDWKEVTFQEAITQLAKELKIDIELDPEGLDEAGVTKDQRVTYSYRDRMGKHVLNSLLAPHYLRYDIRDDVVTITSQDKRGEPWQTRLYNIRDLLDSPWTKQAIGGNAAPPGVLVSPREDAVKATWQHVAGEIIELITSSIDSDSWVDNGGQASITVYRGMLAIVQTEDAHDRILLLLNHLRKAEKSQAGEVFVLP